MRESNDETVELSLQCHAETGKAMLLSDDGDEKNAIWIPKSQIVALPTETSGIGTYEIKEWIAKKNGMI